MKKSSSIIKALTLAMLAASPAAANAQSVFTNASGGATWQTAGNWSPVGVPTASTDVAINAVSANQSSGTMLSANNVTVANTNPSGFIFLRIAGPTTSGLNMSSLTVGGNIAAATSSVHFMVAGAANVSGNVTLAPGDGGGQLLFTAPGALNVGGGAGSIINPAAGDGEARIEIRTINPTIHAANVGADTLALGFGSAAGSLAINPGQTYDVSVVNFQGTGNMTLNLNGGDFMSRYLHLNGAGGTSNSTLNLNGGTLSAALIQRNLNGASQVFNWNNGTISNRAGYDLTLRRGAGATQNLVLSLAETGARTFDIGANRTATLEATAILVNQAGANGTLNKAGAGTLVLAGANTYTGDTTISAGTLAIAGTGSIANTKAVNLGANGTLDVSAVLSAFSFASGQTLKGSGTVTGNMTMASGSTLAIGTSLGTMTFNNNLTLAAGSASDFQINGLTSGLHDLAQGGPGSQAVSFGGTLNLLFSPGFNTVGTVQIFDFDTYAGSFTTVNTTGLASGFSATFDDLTGVVTVVIPEPSTWALLTASLLFLTVLRRRRRAAG